MKQTRFTWDFWQVQIMTQGNYYLATYGEIAYGLGDDGVLPYINGTANKEQIGFQ